MEKLTRVVEFAGIASGDGECFCFDRLTVEDRAEVYRKMRDMVGEWPEWFDPGAGLMYPSELLPDGSNGRRGIFRITIEFTPVPQ